MSDVSDNLYPTSSEYFAPEEPEEQVKEREAQEASVVREMKIIGEVIERFNEGIAFYKSIDSIPDDVLLNPAETAQTILGNKKAVAVLQIEKERLVSLIESIEE